MTKYYKLTLSLTSGWYGPNETLEQRVQCDNGNGQPLSPGPTFSIVRLQVLKCSDAIAQVEIAALANDNDDGEPFFTLVEGPDFDVDYDQIRTDFLA